MLPLAPLISALVVRPDVRMDPTPLKGQPFRRYLTRDRLGREVAFYLSEAQGKERRPLAVFVQGSGHASCFAEANGRLVPQNGFMTLFDQAKGAVRVLVVEKPGVRLLERGDEVPARAFRQEHTLGRWSEAVGASLRAALTLPGIDPRRVLAVGHSEGGLVACRVAARERRVTHAAVLAGGGPTQLYDLVALARKGAFFADVSADADARVAYLAAQWKRVLADPQSADRDFLGHPYRRWTSFLADSPAAELSKFGGRIYIGQGSEDTAVDPSSADALYAELLREGKRVTYDRIPRADHAFSFPGERPGEGWAQEMNRVLAWFLGA